MSPAFVRQSPDRLCLDREGRCRRGAVRPALRTWTSSDGKEQVDEARNKSAKSPHRTFSSNAVKRKGGLAGESTEDLPYLLKTLLGKPGSIARVQTMGCQLIAKPAENTLGAEVVTHEQRSA